jgi:hypothetical protein
MISIIQSSEKRLIVLRLAVRGLESTIRYIINIRIESNLVLIILGVSLNLISVLVDPLIIFSVELQNIQVILELIGLSRVRLSYFFFRHY